MEKLRTASKKWSAISVAQWFRMTFRFVTDTQTNWYRFWTDTTANGRGFGDCSEVRLHFLFNLFVQPKLTIRIPFPPACFLQVPQIIIYKCIIYVTGSAKTGLITAQYFDTSIHYQVSLPKWSSLEWAASAGYFFPAHWWSARVVWVFDGALVRR